MIQKQNIYNLENNKLDSNNDTIKEDEDEDENNN